MSLQDVLSKALDHGVFLYVEDDRLRYRVRRGTLPDDLRAELAAHREELVRHLKRVQERTDRADRAGRGDEPRFEPPPIVPVEVPVRTPVGGETGEERLGQQDGALPDADAAPRVPLSYGQQRLWYIDRLGEGSRQYQATSAYRLTGRVDLGALRRSFATLVERHRTLRTVVAEEDGTPYQAVLPRFEMALPVTDLSRLPEERREAELLRLIDRGARQPFDLGRDLMLRAHLTRLAPERHVLRIGLHHVASDAWSLGVLHAEFAALYAAYREGRTPELPPIGLHYADYAAWQRSWLEGDVLDRQLDYWRERLRGAPEVHALPVDRPRPPRQSHAGSARGRGVPESLRARVLAECRRSDVTLFMYLQTVFALLLWRYGGDPDVVMGVPVAGRVRPELEPIIGLFVNTVVLRTELDPEATFEELLQRNRRLFLDALAHQHVPFETLVEALDPVRRAEISPVFQVLFAFERDDPRPFSLPGLELEEIEDGPRATKFELILNAVESPDALSVDFSYSAEIFHETTIDRMLESFVALLESAVEAPDRPVREHDGLSRAQRHRVLRELEDRRRFPGAALRVLDPLGTPVPEGGAGALWRAEPAGPAPDDGVDDRTWRPTGDLARWTPDGLELLGRVGDRVTVGGIRVDLAGVRRALAAAPEVERFAVAVRTDRADRELLAVYLVPAGGSEGEGPNLVDLADLADPAAPTGLGRTLAAALDEPAVPFALVPVERIPLDGAGEPDLDGLPAPDGPFRPEEAVLRPETPTEERMVPVWCKVLKRETIGVEEDFFAAGGASLSMIVLIKRISQELGVDLPLKAFIEHPTIRGTARWVEAALGGGEAPAGPPAAGEAPTAATAATAAGAPATPRPADRPLVPLEPARRARPMPVSFAQARIWFITQLERSRSSYNIVGALRLTGRLCRRSLRRAFQSLVERHAILRTVYRQEAHEPVQSILRDVTFRLPLQDLAGLPPGRREEAVRAEVEEESFRPFDLAREPSLRARLLRLSGDEHVLLVDMHHIASDGWSIGVFTRELGALYAAHLRGAPDPLPALPVQYCDYAVWQRSWLRGEVFDRHLAFWKEHLEHPPKVHALPLDRPRPAEQSYRGAHHTAGVDPALARELVELSRAHDATLFMTLHAALAVLIHRYGGDDDLVLGTPVANRLQREVEPLIGCFVNTLALRSDLSDDPRFTDFLRAGREGLLQAYAHQSLPFELLVEELNPARDLRHAPLFQILFAFQDLEGAESSEADLGGTDLALPGLEVSSLDGEYPVSKFDLTLYARSEDDGLRLVWEYATDLFTEATVARIAASYGALLASLARAPETRVGLLSLMTEAEERQVARLAGSPDPAADGACLHGLFAARVRERPDAVALLDGSRAWSYAGLERAAGRLARRLADRGVGPGDLVGLCAERSADLVIGILGILKAGAGYVPLDPGYPDRRLRVMLEDTGVSLVLAGAAVRTLVPVDERSLLILDRVLDRTPGPTPDRASTAGGGRREPEPDLEPDREPAPDPDALAYVIFTSGSTGRPKAVGISHRNASALVRWAVATFSPRELDGVLASTSVSFDLSVFELFAPLAAGGTVILAANALELPTLLHRERVRLVNTVPSVMSELLRLGDLPRSAETVCLAGEVLDGDLARRVLATGVRLLNLYGPSEDTTYSTGSEVRAFEGTGSGEPTIGRPVAGGQAHVLDPGLRPVPRGVVGELCLGGAGVARGYLGRPARTAERFVPDDRGGAAGARLYRTGDLARWRPDGDLEYLGRMDRQVKVRGFRIELGEIEAALRAHPEVAEAVVAVRGDGVDERRLVAYLVPEGAEPPTRLRSWLGSRLPGAMVPSAFVALERLPRTPNGKLDRRALPDPGEDAVEKAEFVAPATPTERTLCTLWRDLLRLERVGIEDGFFELGGHSLLAARLVSAVREELGVEVPLRIVFEKPTVLGLATWIDLYRTGSAGSAAPDTAADAAAGDVEEGEEVLL